MAQPAKVEEKLADSDRPLLFRKVTHISLHLGIQTYLALFDQLKDGDRGHCLSYRGQPVCGVGSCRNFVFQVSVTESLDPHVAILDESDGHSRNALALHLLADELLIGAKLLGIFVGVSSFWSGSFDNDTRRKPATGGEPRVAPPLLRRGLRENVRAREHQEHH